MSDQINLHFAHIAKLALETATGLRSTAGGFVEIQDTLAHIEELVLTEDVPSYPRQLFMFPEITNTPREDN